MKTSEIIFSQIKSGDYLSKARVRRIAVIYLAASLISLAVLMITSDGFKDALGRPLGTDFMASYAAGSAAAEDGAAAAYDSERVYAEHQRILGEQEPPYWPFLYPPAFIFIAMGLAGAPYLAGWLGWMAATLAAYGAAMQRLAPGGFALLLAIALPAAYTNFLHGQNGFLIAALFAAGMHCLQEKKPVLAGLALGLLAIKPQYGVLIPIALAAGGQWRAFGAAAAAALATLALPTVAFGADIWAGFFEVMRAARIEVMEAGAIGFEKIQSVFAQARFLGAPVATAYALHGATLIGVALFVGQLWRGPARADVKAAGLIVASVLATPYAVDYDLVMLAPAMAFLIRDGVARGFGSFEKTILLFAAFAPVIARPIGMATHLSAGLLALVLMLFIVRRRAR